eukprot:m.352461 g.352461  ORF g.352461 m.352461 type:complete len:220 (+) comp16525_c0_seq1:58-717(+)
MSKQGGDQGSFQGSAPPQTPSPIPVSAHSVSIPPPTMAYQQGYQSSGAPMQVQHPPQYQAPGQPLIPAEPSQSRGEADETTGNDIYNNYHTTVNLDFDSTFMESEDISDRKYLLMVRQLNGTIYNAIKDVIHLIASATFGLLTAIFVAFFVSFATVMFTYFVSPFTKLWVFMVRSAAMPWRVFMRAGLDPCFESISLTFSRLRLKAKVDADAQYKERTV